MIFSSGLLIAFLTFALVGSITPGPNNTMLLISGVHFGFRRTIPLILGVTFGFGFLMLVIGMGLGEAFVKWPVLYTLLRYGCAAYLLYLAWCIARSGQIKMKDEAKKPVTFLQAVALQWVNPKAWVMGIVAVATYVPKQNFFANIIVLIGLFLIFVFCSAGIWTLFGSWIQRFLHRPHYLRTFNIAMAILLILSLYPLLVQNI